MTEIDPPGEFSTKPFVYDVSDLRALNWQVVRWWTLLLAIVIFGWLVWFFGSIMLEEGFDWILLGILVVIIVVASGSWTWRPVLMHRSLHRDGAIGPMTIGIGSEHLVVHSERADACIKWSGIKRIKLKGPRLFLFSSRLVAHIVPRRAFDSDAEFEAFVSAAKDRWETHHRL